MKRFLALSSVLFLTIVLTSKGDVYSHCEIPCGILSWYTTRLFAIGPWRRGRDFCTWTVTPVVFVTGPPVWLRVEQFIGGPKKNRAPGPN